MKKLSEFKQQIGLDEASIYGYKKDRWNVHPIKGGQMKKTSSGHTLEVYPKIGTGRYTGKFDGDEIITHIDKDAVKKHLEHHLTTLKEQAPLPSPEGSTPPSTTYGHDPVYNSSGTSTGDGNHDEKAVVVMDAGSLADLHKSLLAISNHTWDYFPNQEIEKRLNLYGYTAYMDGDYAMGDDETDGEDIWYIYRYDTGDQAMNCYINIAWEQDDDGDFYIDADVDTIPPADMMAFMSDMDDTPIEDNDHQEPHPPANLNAYVDDGTIVAESTASQRRFRNMFRATEKENVEKAKSFNPGDRIRTKMGGQIPGVVKKVEGTTVHFEVDTHKHPFNNNTGKKIMTAHVTNVVKEDLNESFHWYSDEKGVYHHLKKHGGSVEDDERPYHQFKHHIIIKDTSGGETTHYHHFTNSDRQAHRLKQMAHEDGREVLKEDADSQYAVGYDHGVRGVAKKSGYEKSPAYQKGHDAGSNDRESAQRLAAKRRAREDRMMAAEGTLASFKNKLGL